MDQCLIFSSSLGSGGGGRSLKIYEGSINIRNASPILSVGGVMISYWPSGEAVVQSIKIGRYEADIDNVEEVNSYSYCARQ